MSKIHTSRVGWLAVARVLHFLSNVTMMFVVSLGLVMAFPLARPLDFFYPRVGQSFCSSSRGNGSSGKLSGLGSCPGIPEWAYRRVEERSNG